MSSHPFSLGGLYGSVISNSAHPAVIPTAICRGAHLARTPAGGPPGFITDTLSAPRGASDSDAETTLRAPSALSSVNQRTTSDAQRGLEVPCAARRASTSLGSPGIS